MTHVPRFAGYNSRNEWLWQTLDMSTMCGPSFGFKFPQQFQFKESNHRKIRNPHDFYLPIRGKKWHRLILLQIWCKISWVRSYGRLYYYVKWTGIVSTFATNERPSNAMVTSLQSRMRSGPYLTQKCGVRQGSRLKASYEFHLKGLSNLSPSTEALLQIQDVNPRI